MKQFKSKTIWVGVITIIHGLSPFMESYDPASIQWLQVQAGLGMIFMRTGVQKAVDAAAPGTTVTGNDQ